MALEKIQHSIFQFTVCVLLSLSYVGSSTKRFTLLIERPGSQASRRLSPSGGSTYFPSLFQFCPQSHVLRVTRQSYRWRPSRTDAIGLHRLPKRNDDAGHNSHNTTCPTARSLIFYRLLSSPRFCVVFAGTTLPLRSS